MVRLLLATTLICTFSAHALAQSAADSPTVIAGKSTKLHIAMTLNPDCTSMGYAEIRFISQPQHGKVSLKRAKDFSGFPPSSPMHVCNTKAAPAVQLWYTANPGFTGVDEFTLLTVYASGNTQQRTLKVKVLP